MKRLAVLVMLTALLLSGCAHTERPEAVVERWLNSLNQGSAGRPGQYANKNESSMVVPHWWSCDPGVLDVIEVGKADTFHTRFERSDYLVARVPYRITYASDAPTRCMPHLSPIEAIPDVAVLARPDNGSWHINGLLPSDQAPGNLHVPSQGGSPVISTSAVIWVVGLIVGMVLCGIVAILMRAMPRPAPLSSEPIDPEEARGL